MKKESSLLYEKFNKGIEPQKRIIGKKNFTYRLILDVLEPYLAKGKRVLDIGCGAGTLSFYIAKRGNQVVGIDISLNSIRTCCLSVKNLGLENNVEFRQLNFPKDPIKGCFDLVLCIEVLEHLPEDKKAINYIFKLLLPNGIAIISTPSKNAPLYRLSYSKNFDRKVGHLRRYSENELKTIVSESGFKILEVRKTEGVLRNFLFLNNIAGKSIRLLNKIGFLSDLITLLDKLTISFFGNSNIIFVAQKP